MFSTFFMMRGICDANRSHRENFKNCDFFIAILLYRICIHKSIEFNIDTRIFPAILPVTDIYLKLMTFGHKIYNYKTESRNFSRTKSKIFFFFWTQKNVGK